MPAKSPFELFDAENDRGQLSYSFNRWSKGMNKQFIIGEHSGKLALQLSADQLNNQTNAFGFQVFVGDKQPHGLPSGSSVSKLMINGKATGSNSVPLHVLLISRDGSAYGAEIMLNEKSSDNLNTAKKIANVGKKGKGTDEFATPSLDGFFKSRITYFTEQPFMIFDSTGIAKKFGKFPIEGEINNKPQVFQGIFDYDPQRKLLLYSCSFIGYIALYKLQTEKNIEMVWENFFLNKDYRINNKTLKWNNNHKRGLMDVAIINDCIIQLVASNSRF